MTAGFHWLLEWWWDWVARGALQATPVLLVAAVVDVILPAKVAPRWRVLVWTAAAGKLLLPGLSPFDPGLYGARLDSPMGTAEALGAVVWLLPVVWGCGALVLAGGSALYVHRQLRLWKGGSTAATSAIIVESLTRSARAIGIEAPRLVITRSVCGPVLFALPPRPLLFWPAELEGKLSAFEVEQAIRHELTHLRRRDGWRELGWSALLAIFWFHPLVWWAARRMRALREQCCDRSAAALPGHDGKSYRSALLRVALFAANDPVEYRPAGLALVDPRAPLAHRLALLPEADERQCLAGWRAMAAGLGLTTVLAAWPLLDWADRRSHEVAGSISRPPGSMQLRFMVLERLAEEEKSRR